MKRIWKWLVVITVAVFISTYALYLLYPVGYKEEVLKYAEEYGIDPYLVFSIIRTESKFNKDAISRKEARGLMQIRDITADWANEELKIEDLSSDMHFDPDTNIKIGCWYIAKLMKLYNEDLTKVLAAYNAGIGNVNKWIEDGKLNDIPFKETRDYVEKTKNNLKVYKLLY